MTAAPGRISTMVITPQHHLAPNILVFAQDHLVGAIVELDLETLFFKTAYGVHGIADRVEVYRNGIP